MLISGIAKVYHNVRHWANRLYNAVHFSGYRSKPAKEVFEDIYRNNRWGGLSSSGPGSELDQTKQVRVRLPEIIDEYQIKSILDVPCGDWNWMQYSDLSKVKYTGGDIVESIVSGNQPYARNGRSFKYLNLLTQELPVNDLIFCRDCLVHFSYEDIRRAIGNMTRSGCRYLLTTTFPGRKNYNIVTGNWRPIDLQSAPFNLPPPLLMISEDCTEGDGRYADKCMGLWNLNSLREP